MKRIALFFIYLYQRLSFLFPSRCIYIPSCSEYAKEAFLKYPFLKALRLVFLRLIRCHPLAKGGFDPLI